MICPDCRSQIEDGLETCPACNAVLPVRAKGGQDLSALWAGAAAKAEFPEDDTSPGSRPGAPFDPKMTGQQMRAPFGPRGGGAPGRQGRRLDVTGPHPAPAVPRTHPGGRGGTDFTGPVAPRGGAAPPGPPTGQAALETRVVALDPEANRGTQVVEISLPPMVKRKAADRARSGGAGRSGGSLVEARFRGRAGLELEESGVSRSIDELLAALRLFYARLHRFDRWTVWTLCLAFVASFLPWCRVQGYGLTAGIQDYGPLTAALALGALICTYLRSVRRRLGVLLLLAQLLVTAGMAAVLVFRYISAVEVQFTFGIYLTALAAAASVLLTLGRLSRVTV